MDFQPVPSVPPPLPASAARLRRIYGRRRASWGAQSLWEGPDHLLVVRHGNFTENYQRLFLRDIESIVTQPSARRKVWNMALGLLAALALIMAGLVPGGIWPFGIFALLLGALMAANASRGPTCRVEVNTRVNSVRLYGFVRTRRAQREVARLAELIAAAQGAYDAQAHAAALVAVTAAQGVSDVSGESDEPDVSDVSGVLAATPAARARRSAVAPRLRQPDHGGWHRLLAVMLVIETPAFMPFLMTRFAAMLSVVAVCLLLTFLLTCVVSVRNVRLLAPLAWRRWSWTVLGYQVLRGMSVFITFSVFNFRHAMTHPQGGVFFSGAEDLAASLFVRAMLACSAVISLIMAAWGAFALRRGTTAAGALPPPLPSTPSPAPQEGPPANAAS